MFLFLCADFFLSLYEILLYVLAFKEKISLRLCRPGTAQPPHGDMTFGAEGGFGPRNRATGYEECTFLLPTCIKLVIVKHNALVRGLGDCAHVLC